MKKFVLILIGLVLLAAIAFGIFVFTYDVNQLRPILEEHLSQSIGKKIDLGKISLTWQGAFALRLEQVSLYSGRTAQTKPLLTLDSADARLDFWPLLQRKIRVGSVVIRTPHLELVKKRNGQLSGFDAGPPASSAAPSMAASKKSNPAVAEAALSFLVHEVSLEDGSVSYRDETQVRPAEWFIRNIDLKIQDVSINQDIPIKAQAAFLSDKHNATLDGAAFFSAKSQTFTIKKLRLATELSQIKPEYLAQALGGEVKNPRLEGSLVIELTRPLDVSAFDMEQLAAQISLTNGRYFESALGQPLDNIKLEAQISGTTLTIQGFSAKFAGGDIAGSGTFTDVMAQPTASFRISLIGMDLNELIPPTSSSEPYLEGRSSVTFQGSFAGMAQTSITRSLQGQGQLSIGKGVIRNFNMVREVFNSLSLIPRLVEKLQSELPQSYEEKLNAKDTFLNPINIPFSISAGVLHIPQAVVAADTFGLRGAANVTLNGGLQAQTVLSIDPDLSKAMIKSVNELSYLTDAQGQIEIPVSASGILPHVKVLPDLGYVASKLAITKTTEWVESLVQKKLGRKESGAQPDTANQKTQPTQTTAVADFLGQLLGGTKKSTSNNQTS